MILGAASGLVESRIGFLGYSVAIFVNFIAVNVVNIGLSSLL